MRFAVLRCKAATMLVAAIVLTASSSASAHEGNMDWLPSKVAHPGDHCIEAWSYSIFSGPELFFEQESGGVGVDGTDDDDLPTTFYSLTEHRILYRTQPGATGSVLGEAAARLKLSFVDDCEDPYDRLCKTTSNVNQVDTIDTIKQIHVRFVGSNKVYVGFTGSGRVVVTWYGGGKAAQIKAFVSKSCRHADFTRLLGFKSSIHVFVGGK